MSWHDTIYYYNKITRILYKNVAWTIVLVFSIFESVIVVVFYFYFRFSNVHRLTIQWNNFKFSIISKYNCEQLQALSGVLSAEKKIKSQMVVKSF